MLQIQDLPQLGHAGAWAHHSGCPRCQSSNSGVHERLDSSLAVLNHRHQRQSQNSWGLGSWGLLCGEGSGIAARAVEGEVGRQKLRQVELSAWLRDEMTSNVSVSVSGILNANVSVMATLSM